MSRFDRLLHRIYPNLGAYTRIVGLIVKKYYLLLSQMLHKSLGRTDLSQISGSNYSDTVVILSLNLPVYITGMNKIPQVAVVIV